MCKWSILFARCAPSSTSSAARLQTPLSSPPPPPPPHRHCRAVRFYRVHNDDDDARWRRAWEGRRRVVAEPPSPRTTTTRTTTTTADSIARNAPRVVSTRPTRRRRRRRGRRHTLLPNFRPGSFLSSAVATDPTAVSARVSSAVAVFFLFQIRTEHGVFLGGYFFLSRSTAPDPLFIHRTLQNGVRAAPSIYLPVTRGAIAAPAVCLWPCRPTSVAANRWRGRAEHGNKNSRPARRSVVRRVVRVRPANLIFVSSDAGSKRVSDPLTPFRFLPHFWPTVFFNLPRQAQIGLSGETKPFSLNYL